VTCPVLLDSEVGEYVFRSTLPQGYYCRVLAEESAAVEINLRPTSYKVPLSIIGGGVQNKAEDLKEITSTMKTSPTEKRREIIKTLMKKEKRPHAVCAVQTFRNPQTGPMLFVFVMYYQRLGWSVIIYDRLGAHREYFKDLNDLPGVFYHPYTLYQLAEPGKFDKEYNKLQDNEFKVFYNYEKKAGYKGSLLKDTADHDGDKARTYDHARLEYDFMDVILYVDADELFYCPQAHAPIPSHSRMLSVIHAESISTLALRDVKARGLSNSTLEDPTINITIPSTPDKSDYRSSKKKLDSLQMNISLLENQQRQYQQKLISRFSSLGIEEMRFVRIPYSGLAPSEFNNTLHNRSNTDFTDQTMNCMTKGYESRNIAKMLSCWSSASSFDNFPKSADFASVCPFHYNHWSCDGGKAGMFICIYIYIHIRYECICI
jgi:hypothetical protein